MLKDKKVGIVGCGKRFNTIYYEILQKLNCNLFIWNRTKEKLDNFKGLCNVNVVSNLEEFQKIDPEIIICTIPGHARKKIIVELLEKTNSKILIETPVSDPELVNLSIQNNNKLGVLEQWPFLPLEQFKELVYNSKTIERPYWVYNDGRTFDYHAMAQLRSYINKASPTIVKGSIINVDQEGHYDKSKKLNTTSDFWTHGHVQMTNGSLLSHSFCYNCKVSELKPLQMIKCYSSNGSIITGRINNLNDDYELSEVRYLNSEKIPVIEKLIINRDHDVTIEIKGCNQVWYNKYSKLGLNDQQTAIATVIENGLNGKLYSPKDSYVDSIMIDAMKQSGLSNQTLTFGS